MLIKFNDSIENAKAYTFYSDPGHGWLKVPFKLLESLGIAEQVSTYSYMYGQFAYLEEDCDFSLFRKAMGEHGLNFRIIDKQSDTPAKIRSYRHYSASQFRTMPKGIVGEHIEYAGNKYQIKSDLKRRGFEVYHVNSGMTYRLPRKCLTEAKAIKLELRGMI